MVAIAVAALAAPCVHADAPDDIEQIVVVAHKDAAATPTRPLPVVGHVRPGRIPRASRRVLNQRATAS